MSLLHQHHLMLYKLFPTWMFFSSIFKLYTYIQVIIEYLLLVVPLCQTLLQSKVIWKFFAVLKSKRPNMIFGQMDGLCLPSDIKILYSTVNNHYVYVRKKKTTTKQELTESSALGLQEATERVSKTILM